MPFKRNKALNAFCYSTVCKCKTKEYFNCITETWSAREPAWETEGRTVLPLW